ncbi:retrovirus-related Pol polyprotein from transposon 17.6 [Trichonephila clavipes]|nr:retrovirus-related Pol polyprotein from transposon 17.6 [Trichonephila clavipes]
MKHVSNQGESPRLILNTVLTRVITPPIATSPYRMNPVKKEVLRKQIEELLRQNVIEECESPYAAPVVLFPKPNGKLRLCVDYRKLNSVKKVDAYPLPRMDDLLNEATPTSFMSTIDLQSGYHQVKVADVYQDKTAFVYPFGTYRYLLPTNVKEVQSLLQTCSWFRRYVPNFADIARPLSSLTKKKVQWHWGPEQHESFETLKMRLMTPPILKQADGSKPFTIRTDASSYALGAVLLQGSGPDEHVIEYASRLMIPSERNYSTTEWEALAVVWALEKFRGYVENQQIFLASDHQPLK